MNWLIARLKERSSWIAIFTLAGLVGIKIEPEFREAIINAILAVAAVAAFVFRENVKERESDALPPIELQGKSDSSPATPNHLDGITDSDRAIARAVRTKSAELRAGLPPRRETETRDGWNG